jgi:transmembrane sensor
MGTVDRKSYRDARRRARAEASAWVVRLHGPHRSPALEAGLREWLAADPEHARQFERVTDVWDAGPQVPISGVPRVRAQRRLPASRIWAAAVSIALVCLVAAYLFVGLRSGTVYRNGIGPLRVIRLEEGSRVSLDAQSEVRVAYSDTERRVQLEYGQAYFQVSHNPGWPFVVVVGQHQITDIGTAFMVRYAPSSTAITLIEGRVAVSSRSQAARETDGTGSKPSTPVPIILAPGQRLTFARDRPPKLDAPPADDVTAWLRGEIMLDDTPLTRVVATLNRYDATLLGIDDPRVAHLRVSGIYHTGNNREFAFLLEKLYGIPFSERGGRIILGASPSRSP